MGFEFLIVEKQGGLFDFGPTLPLLAIQLLGLACLLTITFLKPLSLRLSERAQIISNNKYLTSVYSRMAKSSSERTQKKYLRLSKFNGKILRRL
jgi:hypothetical protein